MVLSKPRIPNLFIIGAPKCGTTAWREYLNNHHDIKFTATKEPHYHSKDFPNFRWAKTKSDYLALFNDIPEDTRFAGEASVMYLYSEVAAESIRQLCPDARFLIFIRKHLPFLISYHAQLLLNHDEVEPDFQVAWSLQAERASGRSVPDSCSESRFLQYRRVASFAPQIQRVWEHVPKDQTKIVIFEEWVKNPANTYREILDFLGLEHDGFNEFRMLNSRRRDRIRLLGRLTQRPPKSVLFIAQTLRKFLGLKRLGAARLIRRFNQATTISSGTPNPGLRKQIDECFESDRAQLEDLLGRRIDCWDEQS